MKSLTFFLTQIPISLLNLAEQSETEQGDILFDWEIGKTTLSVLIDEESIYFYFKGIKKNKGKVLWSDFSFEIISPFLKEIYES